MDRLSSRPDFLVLVYSGGRPETLTITKQTPPAFLLVADDDRLADRTTALYAALKKAKADVSIHVIPGGGHNISTADIDQMAVAGLLHLI